MDSGRLGGEGKQGFHVRWILLATQVGGWQFFGVGVGWRGVVTVIPPSDLVGGAVGDVVCCSLSRAAGLDCF